MTGVKDSIRHLFGIGTTSSDIFSRDMKSTCSLFLPSPDTVMDTLCDRVDMQGETAEDFVRMIKVIALTSSFAATTKDMEKFVCEVRLCFTVFFLKYGFQYCLNNSVFLKLGCTCEICRRVVCCTSTLNYNSNNT